MTESSKRLKLQGFGIKGLVSDLSAGITKSIDSVTGGMANAVLAGVNPVFGLYTVLTATPIGALFTSSIYMSIDSNWAFVLTPHSSRALISCTFLLNSASTSAGGRCVSASKR
jgi:MFS superfamily sulfate permease-like transporter